MTLIFELSSRFGHLFAHDLFREPGLLFAIMLEAVIGSSVYGARPILQS